MPRLVLRKGTQVGLLAILSSTISGVLAQPRQAFDVASLKLMAGPCSQRLPCELDLQTKPTEVATHGCPLGYLIRWAYGLHMYQSNESVGPEWIEPGSDWIRYDLVAKTDHPVAVGDLRLMLRSLLEARLKLKVHREPREMSAYVLSIGDGAAGLHRSEGEGEAKFTPPPPGADGDWWWGAWRFERYQLGELYDFLWRFVPAPIVDETGIQGRYDFELNVGKYKDYYLSPSPGERADLGPVLSRAFREVGLKLEPKRRRVDVLVIDHVERTPTEN